MGANNKKHNNVHKHNTEYSLREKEFQLRTSLLTQLFEENKHVNTIYLFFVVSLIYLSINCMVKDYLDTGRINLGFDGLILVFGKFHIAFMVWIVNNFSTICAYYCFTLWARTRYQLKEKQAKYWDYICLFALVGYYSMSFYVNSRAVTFFKLSAVSTLIALMEAARLMMKLYSFVRTNIPKALVGKSNDEKMYSPPGFSKFLYFLFAPTLIYRDKYPRTTTIRWSFLITTIMEVAGTVLYMNLLSQHVIARAYKQFCIRTFSRGEIVLLTLQNSIPALLLLWSLKFLLIHSVQNFFAEILRFGDRMFYLDWWNSTTLLEYFKKWNFVVGDWIYMYIYKDIYELVAPGRRTVALVISFILSCIVHEWLAYYTLGFFLPVLAANYMAGVFISAIVKAPKLALSQVILFYLQMIGAGVIVSFEVMEIASRINAPLTNSTSYFMNFRSCII